MEGSNGSGGADDRTFRVDFTREGAERLRQRVTEKLKEFMGDYTDDTLVEYVVVLLRNGRRKDEAGRELNVFLGDDSFSFVSWLWDHLSSNLHLYVQPKESLPDDAAQVKSKSNELPGRRSSQLEYASGSIQSDFDCERGKSNKISRSRRNREWKGLVEEAEVFPLQSTVTENVQLEEKTRRRQSISRRSPSPRPRLDRKRERRDEQPPKNSQQRDIGSLPVIDAPRRLLQFAVRDAVRTVQQSSLRAEPPLKRLRSVVSASTADNVIDERPQKIRSVARLPSAVSTAIKAAAEAAEDVTKAKYSGNVFDRLSHSIGRTESINQPSDRRPLVVEDEEDEDFEQMPETNQANYYQRREYEGALTGKMTMSDRDTVMTVDSTSDNDGYDGVDVTRRRGFATSQNAASANKDKKSLMLQYSVAQDTDEVVRKTRSIDEGPASGAAKSSSKIVNISVNVNTWKPPQYHESRDVSQLENRMDVDKSEGNGVKSNVIVKEKNAPVPEKEKEVTRADVQKDAQKNVVSTPSSYTTGRPLEDVDSRTVFVSNVHFAATKDTLSRHFNKFGEVLKVVIITDATTGQPTGSAFVEFLRKESAELALSLNGTSFMSRIVKVVQRSSAHHEAAGMIGWPRIARASTFVSRFGRVAYPRGIVGGAFRGRLPIKTGARSLQWKREAGSTQTSDGAKSSQNASVSSGNTLFSPSGRNLTYVRTESKAEENPATS